MSTPLPDRAMGDGATKTLLAVLALPRPTVRGVANHAGLSAATAYYHLKRLRSIGLVTWEDGADGTLRATCAVVRP